MSIVVNTPTGNIGKLVVQKLLSAGEKVTIIARDPQKVKDFSDHGVKVVKGSLDEPNVLAEAFKGAKSVFWVTPPINGPKHHDWAIQSAKEAVKQAVAAHIHTAVVVSSVGAQVGHGTGVISFLRDVEDEFKAHIANVAILRPGFFFENFLRELPTVTSQGTVYIAIKQDAPAIALVGTEDIALKSLTYLLSDFKGQPTVGIHGPKHLTNKEAWEIISKEIGKEVKIVYVTVEQLSQTLKGYNVPDFIISNIAEYFNAINNNKVWNSEPRTPDTTTTLTLKEWAKNTFLPAYHAASKK